MKVKKIIMSLTVSRMIAGAALLFVVPLSAVFFIIYIWCIISDIADGPLARKFKVTSNLGALLDSAADFFVAMVILYILIPLLDFAPWMLAMVVIVLGIRFVAFSIGFYKYRTFTMLHTYANKGAGVILAIFPLVFGALGLTLAFSFAAIAALLSALEELFITVRSKELDRNITSFLHSYVSRQ